MDPVAPVAQMRDSSKKILIVGAGLAGAVHARELAEAGFMVDVIDRRSHIGGNVYDYVDANGIRIHAYGPHLFHTKIPKTAAWLRRFGEFVPYIHKVRARLSDGRHVPLPINIETVNVMFDQSLSTESDMRAFLQSLERPDQDAKNAAQYLYSKIGTMLTDTFFRPYTRKMWGHDLESMSASVVKRIPIHFDASDTYFNPDEIQMLPKSGYTQVFEEILSHSHITVYLNTSFDKSKLGDYAYCFNSMAIDEYYDGCYGELPYRSIRFHHQTVVNFVNRDWSVTNYTDDGPYTRETAWHLLPNHRQTDTGRATLTREEPCDYRDNNKERYYPVKTNDGRFNDLYLKYKLLASSEKDKISFIGRCGTYQYLDMDQVINQSLTHVTEWITKQ